MSNSPKKRRPGLHRHASRGLILINGEPVRKKARREYDKAKRNLDTARQEIEQFKAEYSVALGNLYQEVGLRKRAQSQFDRALQLEPDNQVALEGVSSLSQTGKKKPGLDALKKLFRIKK